jgi:hypothetical protein
VTRPPEIAELPLEHRRALRDALRAAQAIADGSAAEPRVPAV